MTATSFSMTRDMGVDSIHFLQCNPHKGEHVIAAGEVALFPDRYAFRSAARATLRELISNAMIHVRRSTVEWPWRFSAVREDDDIVWTIADDGPGMLAGYLASHCGREESDSDETLLSLFDDHRTAHCGDPNAGLGFGNAIRSAVGARHRLTLETDGRRLEFAEGRMIVTERDIETRGTTWTVRIRTIPADGSRT